MAAQKTEDLSHLVCFRTSEESYQTLLATTRNILDERLSSPIFIPEDLWARHPFFGVTGGIFTPPKKRVPIEWSDLIRTIATSDDENNHETTVIQLIRSFLFYAVSRGDMRQDRLDSSENPLRGFAFVEKVTEPKPRQRSPPKNKKK